MPQFTYDHIHLRSPDPEATAQYYERMFGAEVLRTMQQGKPRIDLKLGGANIFIAPVAPGDGVNPPPTTPYQGLDHFGLYGQRHRRGRRRPQGQGRRVHQGADHGAAGRARRFPARAGRRVDRAARPQRLRKQNGGEAVCGARAARRNGGRSHPRAI